MNENGKSTRLGRVITIILAFIGFLLVLLAIYADSLRLDSTPDFGVIQMGIFLLGLTSLTVAAYLFVYSLRGKNAPRSLQADIGIRLGATGLVFIYVTGFSDLIGIGTHVNPNFSRPFVGPLQLGGILIGVLVIIAGLLLYYTSRGRRETSSMEFILTNGSKSSGSGANSSVGDSPADTKRPE